MFAPDTSLQSANSGGESQRHESPGGPARGSTEVLCNVVAVTQLIGWFIQQQLKG